MERQQQNVWPFKSVNNTYEGIVTLNKMLHFQMCSKYNDECNWSLLSPLRSDLLSSTRSDEPWGR